MRFYGVTEQGNFEDPHGIPWQHPPRRAPRRGAAAGRRRALPRLLEARPPGGRGSTTRSSSAGTHCSSARWRRPRSCSIATTGWPRRAGAEFLVTRLRGPTVACCDPGRAAAHLLAYAEDHGAARGAAHAGRGRRRHPGSPGCARSHDLIDRFADDDNGGFFTTAPDAESLIVRPRTSRTMRRRRRTPSPRTSCSGSPRSPATTSAGAPPAGSAGSRRWSAAPRRVRLPAAGSRAPRGATHGGRGGRRGRRCGAPSWSTSCEGGSCRPRCVVAPPGVGTDLTPLLEESRPRPRTRPRSCASSSPAGCR